MSFCPIKPQPFTAAQESTKTDSQTVGEHSAVHRVARICATVAAAVCLTTLVSMPVQAESYVSIDGSSVTLENEAEEDLSAGGMRFRLGTQVSEVFDIEGQFGFSFTDDTESYDELSAAYLGAYLKGYIPLGHHSSIFGMAGWTNVSLSQTVGEGEFTEERSGFSWGFGMETQLVGNLDLTADYMSYVRSDGLFEDISAVSIGLKLYF